MEKILIRSKIRKIFKNKQVSDESIDYLDDLIYRKLVEILEDKEEFLPKRIKKDDMIRLTKKWLGE